MKKISLSIYRDLHDLPQVSKNDDEKRCFLKIFDFRNHANIDPNPQMFDKKLLHTHCASARLERYTHC